MPILRVQHTVPAFDAWKVVFDSDPIDRRGGGVRGYSVLRSVSDPNFVMIDLDFDALDEAQAFLRKLEALWSGPAKSITHNPQAWIVENIESVDLEPSAD